jgi:hypothetical protein
MGFFDTLRMGASFFSSPEKKAGDQQEGGILNWLRNLGAGKKAEKIKEGAQVERSGIFGEVFESLLARHFPRISKLMDLSSTIGLTRRDSEVVPWQNEFESLTAFTMFVPDFLLRKITDPLVHSSIFMKVVEYWPALGEKWIKTLKAPNVDPDDVINVLRIMNQDIIAGKVPVDKIISAFH